MLVFLCRYNEDLLGLSQKIAAIYTATDEILKQSYVPAANGVVLYNPFAIYPRLLYTELQRGRLGHMAWQT